MTRHPKAKLTQKRPGWAASLLTTLIAFVLICIGIVLLSQRLGAADPGNEPEEEAAQAERAVRDALGALENAQSALLAADYGEARTLVGRARETLEQLVPDPNPNPNP